MIGQKGMPAIWGGIETHVEQLSTRLVRDDHKVTVYCRHWYSDAKDSSYRGVILRFTPTIHTKNLDAIFHTFFSTLDALRQDFDVIHYHGVGPALLSWIPRLLKPRVKVVVTFHSADRFHDKWGSFAKAILHLGEWAACKFPHQTIVVSKSLQKYVKENYNCEALYIPNGASIPLVQDNPHVLENFNLESGHYLVAVSRLIAHKGIHYLIEAFRRLKEKRPDLVGNYKLVIVGSGVHTEDYVGYLQTLARDVKDVVFTGWQNGIELATLIRNSKIFIHPSTYEGLPLSVLEALAYGKSVVASDIPEHYELIEDTRFLFKSGEVADLERVLLWALENPEVCAVNGLVNKSKAEKEYSWESITTKVEDAYKELVPQKYGLPIFSVKSVK